MPKNVVYYQQSEKIISSGNDDKGMYIILEGKVQIFLSEGDERIVVANLEKHDFFGEISLFSNNPRSASAVATEDAKLVYIDSEEHLKNFLLQNPSFAAKMVSILAQRLARTNEILIGKVSELNRAKVLTESDSFGE